MDFMESALPENSLDGETEATSLDSHSQQTDYSNGYEGILDIYIKAMYKIIICLIEKDFKYAGLDIEYCCRSNILAATTRVRIGK